MYINLRSGKYGKFLINAIATILTLAIITLTTGAAYDKELKKITLVYANAFDGSQLTKNYVTQSTTVEEFLNENNISLNDDEALNLSMDSVIFGGEKIYINKGKQIFVNIHGDVKKVLATKKVLSDVLSDAGIAIDSLDVVVPSLDTKVEENLQVEITRIEIKDVYEDSEIPFETINIPDGTLEAGLTTVKTNGENGINRAIYKVTLVNGVETERQFVSENVYKEPVNQEILVGTKENAKYVNGQKVNYKKKFTVTATAYTATGNRTASGREAQVGVIAVDPKVIPLGTKLYIESTDDGVSWSYGYCIAGDTGGAIKGNKIDLYYNTKGECINFGRRSAVVYVLD